MGSGQVTWATVESWDGAPGPDRVGLLARGTPHAPPPPWGAVCIPWQPHSPLLVSSEPRTLPFLLSAMCPRALRTLRSLGAPG